LKAHSTNLGKTQEDAMSEYLTIVKEWPFYGTTFFPPCKSINNKKLPAKIIIGVNAEGILVLKKDKVRKKDCLLLFFICFDVFFLIRNEYRHTHLRKFVPGRLLPQHLLLNLVHKQNHKNTHLKHGRVQS
jgi:hypothetical protein